MDTEAEGEGMGVERAREREGVGVVALTLRAYFCASLFRISFSSTPVRCDSTASRGLAAPKGLLCTVPHLRTQVSTGPESTSCRPIADGTSGTRVGAGVRCR